MRKKLLVVILIFSVILSFTMICSNSSKLVAEEREPIILNNTVFSNRA